MKKRLFLLIFLVVGLLSAFLRLSVSLATTNNLISPDLKIGRLANNLWLPKLGEGEVTKDINNITAKSAYFVDVDTGEVLFQKNPKEKLPIASLTKVMTVVVSLESKNFDDQILISARAASMEPDHMLLKEGERLTIEELLYGVFLVSANDGAEALAESTVGSREEFVDQMNNKAKQLGMADTLFINPTGLQEDGRKQYSTAYDVALMARYAIKQFPHLVDISSTPHIYLPQAQTHQDYDMYSGINLLTTYPGVLGFKTGYTPEAGLTLITLAKRDGHEIIGVILNSEYRRDDARAILDYSFKKLGVI